MPSNLDKFRNLLQELFQMDLADLDFGIYRIMNQKRDEVVRFLDQDLLPQVRQAFQQYKSADKAALQGKLDKLVSNITAAGLNPDESPNVNELRERIAESAVDVTALENEVFSHLFNFFRRYYSEGDFISQRRYKEGVYAIPYEGEEVKLHWANADQYYVKSSETFRDYAFKIAGGKRVRLHLVAASTEQDNNKPAQGKERRFVLADNPLLGLTVKHIDVIRGVRVVEGTVPDGDRVLVLWRNSDLLDNDALDTWFRKQDYNTRETVYDVFYVNGDNNLENLRRPDQTWKVRLIEEEFQRLMFDVEDV